MAQTFNGATCTFTTAASVVLKFNIRDFSESGNDRAAIDVTTAASTRRQVLYGYAEPSEFTFECVYDRDADQVGGSSTAITRQVLEGLLDDLQALSHLLHADKVSGVAVAGRSTTDLEVEVSVGQIRFVAAEIAGDATGPGYRPGGTTVDRFFLGQQANPLGAINKDAIAIEQPLHVVERLGESLQERSDLLDDQRGEVL